MSPENAPLVEYLKLAAPGMVYSVGLPAPAAIAALTALDLMRREPNGSPGCRPTANCFCAKRGKPNLDVGTSWGYAVVPVILGDSLRTVLLAERLLARGYNAFPIVPPGVPEQSARLRFFISSEHTPDEIEGTVTATREELTRLQREGVSLGTMAKLMKARI